MAMQHPRVPRVHRGAQAAARLVPSSLDEHRSPMGAQPPSRHHRSQVQPLQLNPVLDPEYGRLAATVVAHPPQAALQPPPAQLLGALTGPSQQGDARTREPPPEVEGFVPVAAHARRHRLHGLAHGAALGCASSPAAEEQLQGAPAYALEPYAQDGGRYGGGPPQAEDPMDGTPPKLSSGIVNWQMASLEVSQVAYPVIQAHPQFGLAHQAADAEERHNLARLVTPEGHHTAQARRVESGDGFGHGDVGDAARDGRSGPCAKRRAHASDPASELFGLQCCTILSLLAPASPRAGEWQGRRTF